MSKILTITRKELFTIFHDRNLILIMFLTPLVLSTIMGLAFGGLGGGSITTAFSDIPIAVVNLDEGLNLADDAVTQTNDANPSLNDLALEVGGETINVGEQLLQNPNLEISESNLSASNASFNFGQQLVEILGAQALTNTEAISATETKAEADANNVFNFEDLTCPLLDEAAEIADNGFGFEGTLEDLFDAVELADPAVARAGVERNEYVAAIIIPANFSNSLMPLMPTSDSGAEADVGGAVSDVITGPSEGVVEVYGNSGQSISASIVRAVVEGVVNQFVRLSVALGAFANTTVDTLLANLDLVSLNDLDLSTLDPDLITNGLQNIDASLFEPVACLVVPDAGNIQVKQAPLDEIQTHSPFAITMIILGASQAIFFALFTGIFGMNSIYEERDNWTLQRLIVSPTPRSFILAGKLLGNLAVVATQLTILFLSFTLIVSLVEGEPTFIWGTNVPRLILIIVAISLFVSGLGVFMVGLAKSPEQVQLFGPVVSMTIGALGGAFGFRLPVEIARLSPIWWGTEALERLSNGDLNIGLHLLVLFGVGILLFGLGTILFKRRLEL